MHIVSLKQMNIKLSSSCIKWIKPHRIGALWRVFIQF